MCQFEAHGTYIYIVIIRVACCFLWSLVLCRLVSGFYLWYLYALCILFRRHAYSIDAKPYVDVVLLNQIIYKQYHDIYLTILLHIGAHKHTCEWRRLIVWPINLLGKINLINLLGKINLFTCVLWFIIYRSVHGSLVGGRNTHTHTHTHTPYHTHTHHHPDSLPLPLSHTLTHLIIHHSPVNLRHNQS